MESMEEEKRKQGESKRYKKRKKIRKTERKKMIYNIFHSS